jgi:hypothetical protein
MENLLQDTVIFWRLLKHTAQLWLCQVPLQFCVTFARTHRTAQKRKVSPFCWDDHPMAGFEQLFHFGSYGVFWQSHN